jgi:hypothetical protein
MSLTRSDLMPSTAAAARSSSSILPSTSNPMRLAAAAAPLMMSASLTMPTMDPSAPTTGTALKRELTRSAAASKTVAGAAIDPTSLDITSFAYMAISAAAGL